MLKEIGLLLAQVDKDLVEGPMATDTALDSIVSGTLMKLATVEIGGILLR